MINRREFLSSVMLASMATRLRLSSTWPSAVDYSKLPAQFAGLERESGGRLGVAILDTGSGAMSGYRAEERFPMCSTFKMMLVGAILHRVDAGTERLDRTMPIPAMPLLGHSPLTEPHAGEAMTIADLCAAAIVESDNTAANLLLAEVGGPAGYTQFARSLGDKVTRLDRTEPTLNESAPGDPRDTTSPAAMLGNMRGLLLGKQLVAGSRDQLTGWMMATPYGKERLRAHVPEGWRAADKTGSDGKTTSNDICCFWPKIGAPILIAAYLTECPAPESKRSAVLAAVAALVLA